MCVLSYVWACGCITLTMDENTSPVSAPALDTRGWIPKIILAVILAEGIWSVIVSLTHSLILPALVRFIGDSQSPLGKGDFDISAIFSSILQICLAGIVAIALSYWSRPRPVRRRVKIARTAPAATKTSTPGVSSKGIPSILAVPPVPGPANVATAPVEPEMAAPPAPTVLTAAAPTQAAPSIAPPVSQPTASVARMPVPAKPAATAKPQKPKEVYYNIVGEPINPTEGDD